VTAFGDRAVLVRCARVEQRRSLAAALTAAFPDLLVRHGVDSILVEAPRPEAGLLGLVEEVARRPHRDVAPTRPAADVVRIDVTYDGLDLIEVAGILDCPVAALVRAHAAQRWQVDVMGFAPGFGYLVPVGAPTMDWARVSRRASPRAEVPRGAVAVAAGMSAVYPTAMPGGWQLLGSTPRRMFDPHRADAPALLSPGREVQFVEARA
jgi:KipI family sensor histidine kinase inhibitor